MTYSPEVQARLDVMMEHANGNMEAIKSRLQPHARRLSRAANAILQSDKSDHAKFYALWKIADEMNTFNGKNVACHKGCSHCCHIAVALTTVEAEAIGKKIGRAPNRNARLRSNFNDFRFGYHNPCSFLVNGLCSIYENRPLTCRNHLSLDIDPFLCRLDGDGDGTRPVPLLDRNDFHVAELNIANPTHMACLGDIRDFFPKEEKEKGWLLML